MKIAIDAMGGDYAPEEIVKGAIEASREFTGDIFVLVGQENKINRILGDTPRQNIKIVHTDEFIGMDESPHSALKTKKNSSMKLAAELIKKGECDAMVSAGNTGALFETALFTIGRIPGIKRPALTAFLPTKKKPCMLIDAGANADCKPEYLTQFAKMGSIYMKRVGGIDSPRVGLMNIGEEPGKGNQYYRQVYELLEMEKEINFIGNIEPRVILSGNVDVAVADGFVGNMTLKSLEAAAEFMQSILKEEIKKSIVAKVASLTLKPIFRNMKKRLDHSEHGGALLLGLNGILVKSHGRADARTIYSAILMARRVYAENVQSLITEMASVKKDNKVSETEEIYLK